jgi:hypothetical protein
MNAVTDSDTFSTINPFTGVMDACGIGARTANEFAGLFFSQTL